MVAGADVTFSIDADQQRFLREGVKLIEQQKKSERQFKRQVQGAQGLDRAMGKLIKTGAQMAGTFGSVAAAGLIFRTLHDDMTQRVNVTAQASTNLATAMEPLLSLGENARFAAPLRKEMVATSVAYGRAVEDIIAAQFQLQSGGSDFTREQRRNIREFTLDMTNAFGGTLAGNIRLVTKSFRPFVDTGRTVEDVMARMTLLADRGETNLEELQRRFPEVASKGMAAGFTLEEIASAMVVALEASGDSNKAFTALGNTFLRLKRVQGEHTTANTALVSQLQEMGAAAESVPNLFDQVFGTENFVVADAIIKRFERINDLIGEFERADPNKLQRLLAQRRADPLQRAAETQRIVGAHAARAMFGTGATTQRQLALVAAARQLGLLHQLQRDPRTGLIQEPGFGRITATIAAQGQENVARPEGMRLARELARAGQIDEAMMIASQVGMPLLRRRDPSRPINLRATTTAGINAERFIFDAPEFEAFMAARAGAAGTSGGGDPVTFIQGLTGGAGTQPRAAERFIEALEAGAKSLEAASRSERNVDEQNE